MIRTLRYVDLWSGGQEQVIVEKATQTCRTCDERRFEFLEGQHHTRSASLCGRNAVQVRPQDNATPDFASLAQRLRAVGDVQYNAYILRFHGTDDKGVARSLYAQYVGL